MDKQLKQMKTHFEENLPVSFSEQDKQRVFAAIKETKLTENNSSFFVFRPARIAMLIGGAIAFMIIIIAIAPLSFNDSAGKLNKKRSLDDNIEANEESTILFDHYAGAESADESGLLPFNPSHIQIGEVYGPLKITDIQKVSGDMIVTFTGHLNLSGTFRYQANTLIFSPDDKVTLQIPIAVSDQDRNIAFYVDNLQEIKSSYPNIEENGYNVRIKSLQYHHSPDSTEVAIYLHVKELKRKKT